MEIKYWLLAAGFGLIIFSYDYLERQYRKTPLTIKKGNGLPKTYVFFDATLLVCTFFLINVYFEQAFLIFSCYLSIKMIVDGLYASVTGKFPVISLKGLQYYFTDDDLTGYDQGSGRIQVTARMLGRVLALFFSIYLAFLIFDYI